MPVPLKSVAQITVPDASTLMIAPFDRSSLRDIEKAILESDLGINPNNDGERIRLGVPPLTQVRRRRRKGAAGRDGARCRGLCVSLEPGRTTVLSWQEGSAGLQVLALASSPLDQEGRAPWHALYCARPACLNGSSFMCRPVVQLSCSPHPLSCPTCC